ncbi:hypothetical protein DASC09_006600 [Saccharomycopsis crataegensis]|uniref:PCI domain-containing protein n=1 Tax=Saccharomycopsis crataegensis TaxID=43959 RepID=A0AAV5QFZ4_9ASCO|nr:hypothetical protein DASC09_006600 [Saccharomycopsis crataegensis]
MEAHVEYYDTPAKIEALKYIASSVPSGALDAAIIAIDLLEITNYKRQHFPFFEKIVASNGGKVIDLTASELETKINEKIKEYEEQVREISEILQNLDVDDNAFTMLDDSSEVATVGSQLRDAVFSYAIQQLANDDYSGASSCLNIYVSNYPVTLFGFRDLERSCYVAYISGRYESVTKMKVKLENIISGDLRMESLPQAEIISYFKIQWIILMANFRLKKYENVKVLYNVVINAPPVEGISACDVLETCFIPREQQDAKISNCDNFISKNDILIATLVSTILSSKDKEIKSFLRQHIYEDFFEENPQFLKFSESLVRKKFSAFESSTTELCTTYFQYNYNFRVEDWAHIKKILIMRCILFYFSLIDKISLSDLSQRLGIGKSELITLALQLMKVLNLNMSYDPVDKLFVRSQSKYPTQDLSSIVKNLENYIQATMIQNTVLKALEE